MLVEFASSLRSFLVSHVVGAICMANFRELFPEVDSFVGALGPQSSGSIVFPLSVVVPLVSLSLVLHGTSGMQDSLLLALEMAPPFLVAVGVPLARATAFVPLAKGFDSLKSSKASLGSSIHSYAIVLKGVSVSVASKLMMQGIHFLCN